MNENQKPTIKQMIMSVLASMFGVQKNENRQRDFLYGNPKLFIFIGILMTIGFVGFVVLLVKMAMWFAGR